MSAVISLCCFYNYIEPNFMLSFSESTSICNSMLSENDIEAVQIHVPGMCTYYIDILIHNIRATSVAWANKSSRGFVFDKVRVQW